MAYSKAHKRATEKYQKEHYYRTSVCLPKTLEPIIRKKAEFYGSVNAYLTFLVKSDISDSLIAEVTNIPFEDAP